MPARRTGAVGPVDRDADDQHRSVSRHQDAGALRLVLLLIEQGEAVGRQAVGRKLGQIHRLSPVSRSWMPPQTTVPSSRRKYIRLT